MNRLSKYPWLNWYVSNLKSIPGGKYRYGASPSMQESGTPITMSPFRMGSTPVTCGVWKEYCKAESVRMPDGPGWGYLDNHPMVNVSCEEIMYPDGFCEWASGVAGFKLTLPTDAQWEYAARGGQDGREYPWGNDFDVDNLWWSEEEYGDAGKTAAVDRTDKIYRNGYGLTDMVGNVYQWCADYHNEDYRPTGMDPVDTQENEYRCVRGGPWYAFNPGRFRCAYRDGGFPDVWYDCGGFRLTAGPG